MRCSCFAFLAQAKCSLFSKNSIQIFRLQKNHSGIGARSSTKNILSFQKNTRWLQMPAPSARQCFERKGQLVVRVLHPRYNSVEQQRPTEKSLEEEEHPSQCIPVTSDFQGYTSAHVQICSLSQEGRGTYRSDSGWKCSYEFLSSRVHFKLQSELPNHWK